MAGPLSGYSVLEFAGIGPGPFAAMLLADMGADVIRIDRVSPAGFTPASRDLLTRNRRSIALDLKQPEALETILRLAERADAVLEGFRPGVMERLGLGPEVFSARNPRIVFGRMTGWGQDGPYSQAAGHDINYISLAGALAHFARPGTKPLPPLNLIGDFGGGGMFLAFGVVCAILEAQRSGQGQVVDAAMVDGTAVLMSMFWTMRFSDMFDENSPGTGLLDTGSHFYDTFECSDGLFISLGSIEPQFYSELLRLAGIADEPVFHTQMDQSSWPAAKARITEVFKSKSRDEWCALMEGTDVCFAPVLTMSEAAQHPHNVHRSTYIEHDGLVQPAPAPRFSRTTPVVARGTCSPGQHTREVLAEWGLSTGEIDGLIESGAAR